jgi:hypothetical protein
MTIDTDLSITRNIIGSVAESGFIDLDHIDRSGFKWGGSRNHVDQIMDFLIGIDRNPENSELLKARLKFDREFVRDKYGLPKQGQDNPETYYFTLVGLAKERGVSVLGDREYEQRYGKQMISDGYCDDEEPLIFLHQKPEDLEELRSYNKKFVHEFIHAMQLIKGDFLKAPYELSEYEALVGANLKVELLDSNLIDVTDHIFAWALTTSVVNTYKRFGKQPPWSFEG